MDKEKLVNDLQKIIASEPEKIGRYGTKYYLFSVSEIEGIIELLKRLEESK